MMIEANYYGGTGMRREINLEMLKPDIWLTSHTDTLDLEARRARTVQEGVKVWVDPEGYREWVVSQREKFEATVNKEMGVPAKPQ
jgi:metallo-beta-lactamase class B